MSAHTQHLRLKRGFTIIELLTVIMIIGILTGLAATSYINAQKNARDNARKTNVNDIATAVESYYRVNQTYPGLIGNEPSFAGGSPVGGTNYFGCMGFGKYGIKTQSVYYYYYPTSQSGSLLSNPSLPCGSSTRPASSGSMVGIFDPTTYQPQAAWIPGLGTYMNPIPLEQHYQDSTGGTGFLDSGTGITSSSDPLTGGQALTLIYRHLIGGYAVYTRLENTSSDAQQPKVYTGAIDPKQADGTALEVSNTQVYVLVK
jgi:prepilin-type N-terminal cleavage/methylation domain-containing protein